MEKPYRLFGIVGSPYSMKMRALLRYRRIPFVWIVKDHKVENELAQVKPSIIPVLQYPDGSYHVDSTPMIYELEKRHTKRSVIPDDPGLAFLAHLIEDLADEWVTKAMYLYRWWREADQDFCSRWLIGLMTMGSDNELTENISAMIKARQVSRMPLVGCTKITKPIIEETYLKVIEILDKQFQKTTYLLGSRPSIADFGLFGQLYELWFDPTPQSVMREKSPRLCAWISRLEDASGEEGEWINPDEPLPEGIMEFLKMAGEEYFPFLLANAKAIKEGKSEFTFSIGEKEFKQGTFKYQVKCLKWLRDEYKELDGDAKKRVDTVLKETGCFDALQA